MGVDQSATRPGLLFTPRVHRGRHAKEATSLFEGNNNFSQQRIDSLLGYLTQEQAERKED
jgi:hypothetical protein